MIRRIIQLAALLSLGIFIGSLSAQQTTGAVNLFCQDGNVKASTQGAPSTNTLQGSYPKCTVTVYLTGTTTHATIFKDSSSTPLANPFTANADGSFVFFAASKAGYDVVTSAGIPITFPQAFTYTDIWIANDGGGGSSPCGPLIGDATSTNCGNGNFTSNTGTTNQAFGYQNITTNTASNVVAVGNTNATSISNTGGGSQSSQNVVAIGQNAVNVFTGEWAVGIGLNVLDNITNVNTFQPQGLVAIGNSTGNNISGTSAVQATDLIGIGDNNLNNLSGEEIVAIGSNAADNYTCPSGDIVAIGDGATTNSPGPLSGVVAIGDSAGAQLGLNQTSCSGTTVADIVAIGDETGRIQFVPGTAGNPVMTPQHAVSIGGGWGRIALEVTQYRSARAQEVNISLAPMQLSLSAALVLDLGLRLHHSRALYLRQ